MTSYVYNPSKKVTEILSSYLEFDPAQLELAIWSGNLSLSNVRLRPEAVEPLLNGNVASSSSASSKPPSKSIDNDEYLKYIKPPLAFKLVDSKIGALSMKIPWKRLVWGQGDVKVNIENVTIVLALESRPDFFRNDFAAEHDDDIPQVPIQVSRTKKQKWIREAEKRHLQGKALGPWLNSLRNREIAHSMRTEQTNSVERVEQNMGIASRWLRGITNDFLWRFCVGLQCDIQNVKIVFVQDNIQVGIHLPSNKITAAPEENNDAAPANTITTTSRKESEAADFQPQTTVVDDGVRLNKVIKQIGVGIYVREVPASYNNRPTEIDDVLTSDYILCPVDFDFRLSIYFPHQGDKRTEKSTNNQPRISATIDEATAEASTSTTSSTKKRRRGKHDKMPTTTGNSTNPSTAATDINPPSIPSPSDKRRFLSSSLSSPSLPKPPILGRSATAFAGHTRRNTALLGPSSPQRQRVNIASLPLAQPDDIAAFYAAASSSQDASLAKVDGKLTIGAVQMICSSRHYLLINRFFASCARVRNGRPQKTIHSILDQAHLLSRHSDKSCDLSLCSDIDDKSIHKELADLIRIWWQYALGILLWEIRQRRRLRKIFQKRFLSFSWKHQAYRRAEYVKLYISTHLSRSSSESFLLERLMSIEDEISVEQVLLYRSIARAIHVRGGAFMPDSVLMLKSAGNSMKAGNPAETQQSLDVLEEDEEKEVHSLSFLSTLEDRCEVARARRDATYGNEIPSIEPFLGRSHFASNTELGYEMISLGLDSKTLRSRQSNKSKLSVATASILQINAQQRSSRILFSFTLHLEKIDVLIIEEENAVIFPPENDVMISGCEDSFRFSHSSSISVLTDDERFSLEQNDKMDLPIQGVEKYAEVSPSTDFLVFDAPRNVIFKLSMSPLMFSAMFRSEGSRNFNFSIGNVHAIGEKDVKLLEIGVESSIDKNVCFSNAKATISPDKRIYQSHQNVSAQNAFSLSFVDDKQNQNILQCDTPAIHACFDPPSTKNVILFFRRESATFPQRLLKKSFHEDIRLRVLRQSKVPLASLNSSIRLRGFELTFPLKLNETEQKDEIESTCSGRVPDHGASIRCEIIEVYSGTFVDDLFQEDLCSNSDAYSAVSSDVSGANRAALTRQLSMLNVSELLESRRTALVSKWIVTVSGIDVDLRHGAQKLKIFQLPVDIESVYFGNSDSLQDFDNARFDVIVKISTFDVLISHERVCTVVDLFEEYVQNMLSPREAGDLLDLPPRLEVLSSYINLSMEVSASRIRISFLTQDHDLSQVTVSKQLLLEEILTQFLSVASRFDFAYPYDDALSASLHICLDRLAGIGLNLEESWEAANSVLQHYYGGGDENVRSSDGVDNERDTFATVEDTETHRETLIEKSARRTAKLFNEILISGGSRSDGFSRKDLIFDLADGLHLTYVSLFYDSHLGIGIPSVSVANGEGIHLLMVTKSDGMENIVEETEHDQVSASRSGVYEADEKYSTITRRGQFLFGFYMQRFIADKNSRFGKGGLPLQVLECDSGNCKETLRRQREILDDWEVGVVDFVFSCNLLHDAILTLSESIIFSGKASDSLRRDESEVPLERRTDDWYFFANFHSVSTLLLSDCFAPFVRVFIGDFSAKAVNSSPVTRSWSYCFGARSFLVLNLSPRGENFSAVICQWPDSDDICLQGTSTDGSSVQVVMSGLRIIVLRQFINECLQYFVSGRYGFSKLLQLVRKNAGSSEGSSSSFRFSLTSNDCSIILPRSSSDLDMVCFELKEVTYDSSKCRETFSVPGSNFTKCSNRSRSDQGQSDDGEIARKHICLRDFRIFTSIADEAGNSPVADSSAFRYFFEIMNRPKAGDRVYSPISLSSDVEVDTSLLDSRRSQCVWKEITEYSSSLDIIVDAAPHMRVLITDDSGSSLLNGLNLDLRLSQYCLLLSLWYSNMQELPVMFPYSAVELKNGSGIDKLSIKFPDMGSDELRQLLLEAGVLTSEIVIVLERFSMSCTFDQDYIETGEAIKVPGINFHLHRLVVHVSVDGNGVTRIGCGSSKGVLTDSSKCYQHVLNTGEEAENIRSWADLRFGLQRLLCNIMDPLPMALQFSVFIVPGYSIYNLGMDSTFFCLSDLSTVTKLLEFLTSFGSNPMFKNPVFDASDQVKQIKENLGVNDKGSRIEESENGSNIDFRLWLVNPTLSIPYDSHDCAESGIRIAPSGFWLKYTAIDKLSSIECVSKGLMLVFDDICIEQSCQNGEFGRSLIENLSFGFRFNNDSKTNHSDITLRVPFLDAEACGISSPLISASPALFNPPTVCTPFIQPSRLLGHTVCEISCIFELIPKAWSTLVSFFGEDQKSSLSSVPSSDQAEERTFSCVASLSDIRCFALDPVLGRHLPITVVSLKSLSITSSKFHSSTNVILCPQGENPPEDLQISVDGHLWAEYFKLGLTRSWEPLIEAYKFKALYEVSRFRGTGLSYYSDSPFHVNISSALLAMLDEVLEYFTSSVQSKSNKKPSESEEKNGRSSRISDQCLIVDATHGLNLVQEKPNVLQQRDRIAFSLRNMTGQKIRILRQSEHHDGPENGTIVTYLNHSQAVKLNFLPSISLVNNLKVEEVEYPGLPNSCRPSYPSVPPHTVELQVPGFHWLEGIVVDTFGRSFADIVPASLDIQAKMIADWRLANALKALVEVGLESGGRQVTIRSIFSIVNRTSHCVRLFLSPDASRKPVESLLVMDKEGYEIEFPSIEPRMTYQIPILLCESALRQPGSHLGSAWIKPSTFASDMELFQSFTDYTGKEQNLRVDFCSKAIQLAKAVSESALIFESYRGEDIPSSESSTGLQISCPVLEESGDRLAPFCYVIEVGRSPLVKADKNNSVGNLVHAPITYTFSIHPPFVLVNLLPERGRFELMHAVRHHVLWFGDLDAGEEIEVHSVGLDSPLLLFINLGFAKTPVNEGALVHHGSDEFSAGTRGGLGGLKTIGKAGRAVTKQIGKTLTSIGESPDLRGRKKMSQDPLSYQNQRNRNNRKFTDGKNTELVEDADFAAFGNVDGQAYRMDTGLFSRHDIANETSVIDGLGQRLSLRIENIRGGGGQRRISVYCPYWMVNTTEHCLRYRQENSKLFVSGTVLSPEKNGSLPVTGGRARATYETHLPEIDHAGGGTIFAGLPGALATSPGKCELPPETVADLVDKNLSLEKMASLGFMFNFHGNSIASIGYNKLCVQLGDGTGKTQYESDWSRGVSLDSVGVPQVVGMHCKDGRVLEVTMIVSVAPGLLSSFTKIVRFLPQYVAVNTLPYPIRIWQDCSTSSDIDNYGAERSKWQFKTKQRKKHRSKVNLYEALWGRVSTLDDRGKDTSMGGTSASKTAAYIITVLPNEFMPFCLADTRRERQFRIDIGKPWSLTPSFPADVAGGYVLKINRATDIRLLPHVSTRSNPHYEVQLPADRQTPFAGELGVWFETEWGEANRSLIVKSVKRHGYAYNETDIHVGDELLEIDGVTLSQLSFSQALALLRTRLTEAATTSRTLGASRRIFTRRQSRHGRYQETDMQDNSGTRSVVLVFRTIEERLRRVRMKAARASGELVEDSQSESSISVANIQTAGIPNPSIESSGIYINAELKTTDKSDSPFFLVIRDNPSIPFQIQNRTTKFTIFYRQKGCKNHDWQSAKPGESKFYSWEEPMNFKRLTLRVASEAAFQFSHDQRDVSSDEFGDPMAKNEPETSTTWRKLRKIEDEEDVAFSPSINVHLEEVGFRGYLPLHSPFSKKDSQKYLTLTVDVDGPTRVLAVRDTSGDFLEQQIKIQIEHLKDEIRCEEQRLTELRLIDVFPTAPDENDALARINSQVQRGKMLINDFPHDGIITKCHQVVIEVLEAVGLTSDSFAGLCNPYVEIRLKAGSTGRISLFRKKEVRRTYFIRNSINPKWQSQVFLFDVPSDAVNTTRGFAIQIYVRNFRAYGFHPIVGKARIELHSARNQDPLVGWFPLSGRIGRRELEDHDSHWGRGSIRLRIQWIHSPSGLIRYLCRLSELRLLELQNSLEGLYRQQEMETAAVKKEKAEYDGFKAVRVDDLLRTSKSRPPNDRQRRHQARTSVAKKLQDPLQMLTESTLPLKKIPRAANVSSKSKVHLAAFARAAVAVQRNRRMLGNIMPDGSKRDDFQILNSFLSVSGDFASLPVTTFKTWVFVQALFQDDDLRKEVLGDIIKVGLRRRRNFGRQDGSFVHPQARIESIVARKLLLPLQAPTWMKAMQRSLIEKFILSRNTFEREATRALKSVINPGGWLTIRPITVLNLPETYTGMFVKVRHGSMVLTSHSVDARVCPIWSELEQKKQASMTSSRTVGRLSTKQSPATANDLHIYVAPQMTSGSIRISVVGERGRKNIKTRTELGVLYLPLGSAIAACIDICDSSGSRMEESAQKYTRWFPLTNPKDSIPVEGDDGLSFRPKDTEKESDNLFHEYFAPCIQLSLIWEPHPDENDDAEKSSEEMKNDNVVKREVADTTPPSLVRNYFNADIGRLSLAFIDSQKACEIISVNLVDIDLRFWVTNAKTRMGVTIGWLQIDFQDDNAREFVVLAPTPTGSLIPTIQMLAIKDNIRSASSTLSLDFIDISIAELDLTIEETLLFDVFDFIGSIHVHRGVKPKMKSSEDNINHLNACIHHNFWTVDGEEPFTPLYELFSSSLNEAPENGKRVYIKQIVLGQFKVNFSYLKGRKATFEASNRTDRFDQILVDAGRELLQQQLGSGGESSDVFLMWSLNAGKDDRGVGDERGRDTRNMAVFFATILPNVSDAPIRLPAKSVNHVFSCPTDIAKNIFHFYRGESLKQIYKIIGSLDIVGNPTMLVTSVFSGMKDLVVTPSKALWNSPTDPSSVGLGVAQGTLSFVSHGTSGFFGTLAKVAAAAGQGVAVLSLDNDFRDWHHNTVVVETTNLNRVWKRRGLKSVGQMLSQPITDILSGILRGVFGVFVSPYKGYKRHKNRGLAQGVVVGGVGLIAKPVVGLIDAFTHITASVHDVAKSVNILDKRLQPAIRMRLPYTFGLKGILKPYDYGDARAAWLLRRFPRRTSHLGRKHSSDEIMIHVEIFPSAGTNIFAIATSLRVLLIKVQTLHSGLLNCSLCWEAELSDKASVSSKVTDHGHTGVALYLLLKEKRKPDTSGHGEDSVEDESPFGTSNANDDGNQEESTHSIGLTTPEERLSNTNQLELYDHGTDKSMEGDLVEWFTISAEYQYRRQLIRLHNVISCIVGNFDALIKDSTIGMRGNTEGYKSFGIFHFEPRKNEKTTAKERNQKALGYLPWISDTVFENYRQQNFDDGRMCEYLASKGLKRTFEEALLEWKCEGEPEWLCLALARATYLHTDKIPEPTDFSSSNDKLFQITTPDQSSQLSWPKRSRLTTIRDEESLAERIELSSESDKRLSHVCIGIGSEEESYNQLSWNEDEAGMFLDVYQPDEEVNDITQEEKFQLSTPSLSGSDTSAHSFRTAHMPESLGITTRSSIQEAQEITESSVKSRLATNNYYLQTDERVDEEECPVRLNPQSIPESNKPTEDRLQRMEGLMERLLIFSSEQALRTENPSVHYESLRNEIAVLRSQIDQQTGIHTDMEELRTEIASLRAQLDSAEKRMAWKAEDPNKASDTVNTQNSF